MGRDSDLPKAFHWVSSKYFSYSHPWLCSSWTKKIETNRCGSVADWYFQSRSMVLVAEPETKIFFFGKGRVSIEIISPLHHSSTVARNKNIYFFRWGLNTDWFFFHAPFSYGTLDKNENIYFQPGSSTGWFFSQSSMHHSDVDCPELSCP